jgi:hypothetical protein
LSDYSTSFAEVDIDELMAKFKEDAKETKKEDKKSPAKVK